MPYKDLAGGQSIEDKIFLNTLTEEDSLIVRSSLFHYDKESGKKLDL